MADPFADLLAGGDVEEVKPQDDAFADLISGQDVEQVPLQPEPGFLQKLSAPESVKAAKAPSPYKEEDTTFLEDVAQGVDAFGRGVVDMVPGGEWLASRINRLTQDEQGRDVVTGAKTATTTEEMNRLDEAAKAYAPGAFRAGQASSLVGQALALPAATTVARPITNPLLRTAAKGALMSGEGAAMGALEALDEDKDVGEGAAIGAVASPVLGAGGALLSKAARGAGRYAKELAEEAPLQRLKQAGAINRTGMRRARNIRMADEETAGLLREAGAFGKGGLAKTSGEEAGAAVDKLLGEAREGFEQVSTQMRGKTVDASAVENRLRDIAKEHARLPGGARVASAAEELADQFKEQGANLSFDDAVQVKRMMDDQINWQRESGGTFADLNRFRQDIRSELNKAIDSSVEGAGGDLGQVYQQAKKKYQVGAEFQRLQRTNEERAGLRGLSPSDYGLGLGGAGAGFAMGGPLGSAGGLAAGIVANKIVKGREAAWAATLGEAAGRAAKVVTRLEQTPGLEATARALATAARRGPTQYAAAELAAKEQSPQARQMFDEGDQ